MDPYLEGSEWTSVHATLAVEIAKQLTPRLLPKYIARTEKRYIVSSLEPTDDVGISSIYPDAAVARNIPGGTSLAQSSTTGATAPLTIATMVPDRLPQTTVEIRDVAHRQLVTAIEILSPANKGGDRGEYLERRQRFLLSAVHLVEIDLLRRGKRVPMQRHLPSVPYFAFVGRADRRPLTDVWPITLREPLPKIPIPLLNGDADVPLDLQQALIAVYDGGAYSVSIDYAQAPDIPLDDADAAWATVRIAEWLQKQHP